MQQQQYITQITTTIPSDGDRQQQGRRLADREQDLGQLARVGYSLAHTTTIPGPDFVTIVDTLTRPNID